LNSIRLHDIVIRSKHLNSANDGEVSFIGDYLPNTLASHGIKDEQLIELNCSVKLLHTEFCAYFLLNFSTKSLD